MAAMSLIGPEGRKQLQLAARFATAGLELVISIVVGYFGGRALDRWLGSEPYCSYAGLLLGVVAGFRNLFLLARRGANPEGSPRDDPPNEPASSERNQSDQKP
jgi:ATP synthase protein I